MAVNASRQDEQLETMSKLKVALRLLSYLKRYRWSVVIVVLVMAISVGITLINPLIIESAIDDYLSIKDINGLLRLGIFAVIINIVFVIVVKIRMYMMSKIANKLLKEIRQELYEHIQTLSFTFFDGRPTGKVLARIIGDVNSLKRVLSSAVTNFIPGVFTIVGVVAIMLKKDWKLGLVSISTLPIMIIAFYFMNKVSHQRWQSFRKKSSNLNAYVHEDISGMSVVQSFHAEAESNIIFDGLVEEHKESFKSAVRVADLFSFIVDTSWGLGVMLLYLFGAKMVGAQIVSIGTLVAFGTYIGMFWEPVMRISQFYNQLITNITAAERIFEIMDTEPEISDAESAIEIPDIQGEVTFEHVTFAYEQGTANETLVLDDLSFRVKPGERIALVGPTGAGKTTIVNLLSRFYDIQGGIISIDGYDLKNVQLGSLRKQMGVMTQDNFVFHGTVAENIRYGKMDATMDEVIEAAKAVSAHEFIMRMENGYETQLQERGSGLSIGQRQLIAFARTMISMPRILILDEATSSIDTKTEVLVQKGIEALLKGRTSFVIAHRLSTIQNADRIFVIGEGGIMEQGTSKELLAKKGFYYDLYMAQFTNL